MLNAGSGQDILSNTKNCSRWPLLGLVSPAASKTVIAADTPTFWNHWITWEQPLSPWTAEPCSLFPQS